MNNTKIMKEEKIVYRKIGRKRRIRYKVNKKPKTTICSFYLYNLYIPSHNRVIG